MKSKMNWFITVTLMAVFVISISHTSARAQDGPSSLSRAPHCTNGTASGTYGYHMEGQIVGVGPFLVNGIFTANTDGTSSADVQLVVGNQSFPALGTGGTFKTNDDCTGSGKFRVDALNLEVTYNVVVTDGGEQLEIINTNPGIVLQGVGRRIAKAGKAPSCNNGTIVGSYGGRLNGSIPGVPAVALVGSYTYSVGSSYNGLFSGTDTISLNGQFAPRTDVGTFKMGSNCRGTGFYTDSLGNSVNYVITAVNDGDTLYFMGTDPGVFVSGVAQRIR